MCDTWLCLSGGRSQIRHRAALRRLLFLLRVFSILSSRRVAALRLLPFALPSRLPRSSINVRARRHAMDVPQSPRARRRPKVAAARVWHHRPDGAVGQTRSETNFRKQRQIGILAETASNESAASIKTKSGSTIESQSQSSLIHQSALSISAQSPAAVE